MHPDEQYQDSEDAYNEERYGKPEPSPPHKLKTLVEVGELQSLRASCPNDILAAGWVLMMHDTQGVGHSWRFECRRGENNGRRVEVRMRTSAEALNLIREQVGLPVILVPGPDAGEAGKPAGG